MTYFTDELPLHFASASHCIYLSSAVLVTTRISHENILSCLFSGPTCPSVVGFYLFVHLSIDGSERHVLRF